MHAQHMQTNLARQLPTAVCILNKCVSHHLCAIGDTFVFVVQPAQMRSGGSGSSVMTDTDYAEAVSSLSASLLCVTVSLHWCVVLQPCPAFQRQLTESIRHG